jgi:hypothetical protein
MNDLDLEFDDAVIFELPTFADLEAFCDRFRPRWDGWSHVDEEAWLFAARLDGGSDMAALLRGAGELVAELGLAAIRYCLDGRLYVLEAARPRGAAHLAARSQ